MNRAAARSMQKGIKKPFPASLSPMLCTLIREPFNDPAFIYEKKWDGYRLMCHVKKGRVKLRSRGGQDYTKRYPRLEKALLQLKVDAVIDGEAVVLNKQGKPNFDALQQYHGGNKPIILYAFDLPWLNGYSLMKLPLTERKKILKELIRGNKAVSFSNHYSNGIDLYKKMKKQGLEGIVAKKKDSTYQPGMRGGDWLKVPTEKRQEFVIGGWVESEKNRPFASLLFGAYKKGELEWIGHAAGGFKLAEMPGILRKLKRLEVKKSPFTNKVKANGVAHFVRPVLVANFKFATWTRSGKIRKPATFLGFRSDKPARMVVREDVRVKS